MGPSDRSIGLKQYANYKDGIPDALKAQLSPLQLSQFRPLEHLLTHNFKDSQRPVSYIGQLVPKTVPKP
jgi:hypothetical protein